MNIDSFLVKKTIDLFGYISLEAIVNGQLKQKTTFNMLDLIKIPKINNIQRIQSPLLESLKKSKDKNKSNTAFFSGI